MFRANRPTSPLDSVSAVDFIVYGEGGLFAIEVKNTKRIDGSELRALNNFAQDYPEAKRYMLYEVMIDSVAVESCACRSSNSFLD